jgi:hypothetical protein
MRYMLTHMLIIFHPILDYNHPSLVIPIHIYIVLDIFVRSLLRYRQLRLVLCPPIIPCPIHILSFTTPQCLLVLTIHEHLLVANRSRRRDLLIQVELSHNYIWIMILNHPENESSTHDAFSYDT